MFVKARLIVASFVLTMTAASATAHATSILVNSAWDPSDPPRCTLHDAIIAANTGTAVNGCRAGSGNDVISFSSGSKITLQATLPPIERTLQINGRPTQPKTVINGNNSVQIMVIDSTAMVILSNLTFTNGAPGSLGGPFVGGASIINNGDVSINASVFTNSNFDAGGSGVLGAAIYNNGGLRLSNSTITNNVAITTGVALGTVLNQANTPVTITNCKFSGNKLSGSNAAQGTVYQSSFSPMTVENSSFTDNHVTSSNGTSFGGAIAQSAFGLITVRNCAFMNDSAQSINEDAFGGAIGNGGKNIEIDNSTFTSNSASSTNGTAYGGAIGGVGQSMTISGDTFIGNSVSGGAGASAVAGGGVGSTVTSTTTIINCTFYKNAASGIAGDVFGGGAGLEGSNSVFFSTFLDNSATNNGGSAIGGNFAASDITIVIANSVLAGSGAGGNCGGTFTDGGYNLSDDATCAFSAIGSRNSINPKLATRPASNGGPTQTIALMHGSPAIDKIPHASCVDSNGDPVTIDQRGKPRPDRGDGPSGPCDIGAYEYQDPAFPP